MKWILILIILIAGCASTQPPSPTQAPELTAVTGEIVYRLSSESSARYTIDEVLRGSPKTVVGTTDQVAGDVKVDIESSQIEIGKIVINARTFQTDSARRDGAVVEFVLQSDLPEYEFLEFETTKVEGFPENIIFGEEFNFQITGNLKVREIVKEVTFASEMTINQDSISGSAASIIQRSDYEITIPNVPFVASVDEHVNIRIDFTGSAI